MSISQSRARTVFALMVVALNLVLFLYGLVQLPKDCAPLFKIGSPGIENLARSSDCHETQFAIVAALALPGLLLVTLGILRLRSVLGVSLAAAIFTLINFSEVQREVHSGDSMLFFLRPVWEVIILPTAYGIGKLIDSIVKRVCS